MGVMSVLDRRLYHVANRGLLVVGVLVAIVVVFQFFALPSRRIYSLLDADRPVGVSIPATAGKDVHRSTVTNVIPNVTYESNSRKGEILSNGFEVGNHEDAIHSFTQKRHKYAHDPIVKGRYNAQHQGSNMQFSSQGIPSKGIKILDADLGTSDVLIIVGKSSNGSTTQSAEMQGQTEKSHLLKTSLSNLSEKSKMGTSSSVRNKLVWPTSITQMNSLLLQSFNSSYMVWSSALWFQYRAIMECAWTPNFHVLCVDGRGPGGLLEVTVNSYRQNWRSKMPVSNQILLDFMHLFSGMLPSFQGMRTIVQCYRCI